MIEETYFEFPCSFPIKVMGRNHVELSVVVIDIVRRHVDDFDENTLKTRHSKDGNFVSVTVTIEATSKQQLNAIYQDLTDHPLVLMSF